MNNTKKTNESYMTPLQINTIRNSSYQGHYIHRHLDTNIINADEQITK